ncbi:MAG TPA: HD domain-containing protein [Anaerolineae bacterium]|nr:HD domain-containing protein [Anaerolineae bacterium]
MIDPAHPQKGPWVADLRAGDTFMGFYLARNAQLRTFRDPSRGHYLRMNIMDRTGSIEARVWEDAEETAHLLHEAAIIKLEGEVEAFQDRLQVRVLRLRLAEAEESDRTDMLASTKRDVKTMIQAIDDAIAKLQNENLRSLLEHFFNDASFRKAFLSAPAARRIHHAYLGGLLEHTFEVLQLSKPLIDLYPEIDRDLLVAGILLHDVGKLREFTWETDIEYSDEGRLLGHVVPGAEMVAEAVRHLDGFPEELSIRLQHLILSHHGRYEWGSPRRPKIIEAVALHHLDNLDGQVNRFHCLVAAAKRAGRSWTLYDYMLGRSLYAGPDDDLAIEEQGMTQ